MEDRCNKIEDIYVTGKEGSGKTTVAIKIAIEAKKMGIKPLIISWEDKDWGKVNLLDWAYRKGEVALDWSHFLLKKEMGKSSDLSEYEVDGVGVIAGACNNKCENLEEIISINKNKGTYGIVIVDCCRSLEVTGRAVHVVNAINKDSKVIKEGDIRVTNRFTGALLTNREDATVKMDNAVIDGINTGEGRLLDIKCSDILYRMGIKRAESGFDIRRISNSIKNRVDNIRLRIAGSSDDEGGEVAIEVADNREKIRRN